MTEKEKQANEHKAIRKEKEARSLDEIGDCVSAIKLYYEAAELYRQADMEDKAEKCLDRAATLEGF